MPNLRPIVRTKTHIRCGTPDCDWGIPVLDLSQQEVSRSRRSFRKLLFGASECCSNLIFLGKEPQGKHRGNHDADKCYDGQQPNHLLVCTETDNSAEPAANGTFV